MTVMGWYRPAQVWDLASKECARRPVPMAVLVTAAELLKVPGDAARGTVAAVAEFSPDSGGQGSWSDDLALWAARRQADALTLAKCVVNVIAPELAGDRLVSVTELAAIGGVAPSTLRAYISRGEEQVPSPQAVIGGRSAWSPAGRRGVGRATAPGQCSGDRGDEPRRRNHAPRYRRGLRQIRADLLLGAVGEPPEGASGGRCGGVTGLPSGTSRPGWLGTSPLMSPRLVTAGSFPPDAGRSPSGTPSSTSSPSRHDPDHESVYYGITPPVAHMLDWLIAHNPDSAQHTIGELVGEAERRLEIPRQVTEHSLRLALDLDSSKLDSERRREFLNRAFPPQTTPAA